MLTETGTKVFYGAIRDRGKMESLCYMMVVYIGEALRQIFTMEMVCLNFGLVTATLGSSVKGKR